MFEDVDSESASFHEDMITVIDRLPAPEEYRRVLHLTLQDPSACDVEDQELREALKECPHIETAIFSGIPDLTDETFLVLTDNAINLHEVDLSGCGRITDKGLSGMANQSLPLQSIRLAGVVELTSISISAIVKTCTQLIKLELVDLPLLSPLAVRDIWSFSRKLRTLRLCNCPGITDKAFPSGMADSTSTPPEEKPLPPRPNTWLEVLPPLILRHRAENLRVLDLTSCNITDEAIEGIVSHAPRIQTLILSGCSQLTDNALESIAQLSYHLDVLMLSHVSNITDKGLVKMARQCSNLRCIDVAFCRNLTDMSIFELAGLRSLRRLSLVRVQKVTDIAIFALAEYATSLERLHLSYCDQLSLDAIHILLQSITKLRHLTATGIPSLRRKGVQRFSEPPPPGLDPTQRAVYRAFTGENVALLRRFLDKEQQRRRDAEAKNIQFVERSDDKLDLY